MYAQVTSEGRTAEALCIDALRRPLVGVHMSPHLDVLERVVMASVLHHVGALAHVLTGDMRTGSRLEALCHSASVAARGVRTRVTEIRALANMSLKDEEEPREWTTYTEPCMARCKLVLCTCPHALFTRGEWDSNEDAATAEHVKQAVALVRVC
jgi:hypothetical protein